MDESTMLSLTLARVLRGIASPLPKGFRERAKSLFWGGYRRFAGKTGVTVDIGGAGQFILDTDFAFSGFDTWGGEHNSGFDTFLDLCKEGDTVLDVGAHIGLCTLTASRRVGPGGRLYAFEPGETNAAYLERHLAFNQLDNVSVIRALVGERAEKDVEFYESDLPSGMNSITKYTDLEAATWKQRDQLCLDDFCEQNDIRPDVIKIDVEGAEAAVLRGAQRVLDRHAPKIVLSVHPRHLAMLGESVEALETVIRSAGYRIAEMDGTPIEAFGDRLQEVLLTKASGPGDASTE